VLNSKYLTRFSLVALIVLIAAASPLKLRAQDDAPSDDEMNFTPPPTSTNNSITPPVQIDESDSGSVSDVEEYDG
jgi:hypothetical protein